MDDIEALAGPGNLDWLLEKENPSVRYFTLRDLLGREAGDRELEAARTAIMREGSVPAILAGQLPDGSWGEGGRFYLDKYTGSVWRLLVLAELGADGADPKVRKAADHVLAMSQEAEGKGF